MKKPVALPKLIASDSWDKALKPVTDLNAEVTALGKPIKALTTRHASVPWRELAAANWEATKNPEKIIEGRARAKGQWKFHAPKLRREGLAVVQGATALKTTLEARIATDAKAKPKVTDSLKAKASKELDELIDQTGEFNKRCSEPFDDSDFAALLAKLGRTGMPITAAGIAKEKEKEKEKAEEKRAEKADFEEFKNEAKRLVPPIKRLIAELRKVDEAGDDVVMLVKQIRVEYKRRTGTYQQGKEVDEKFWNHKDQADELRSLAGLIHRGHDEVERRLDDLNTIIVGLKQIAARRKPDLTLQKETDTATGLCNDIRNDCKDLDRLEADAKQAATVVDGGDPPNEKLKPLDTGKLIPDTNRLTRKIREWQKLEPKET